MSASSVGPAFGAVGVEHGRGRTAVEQRPVGGAGRRSPVADLRTNAVAA